MEPFVITLSNNSTIAGIHSLPPPSASGPKSRPLVVGLHGGTYDCHYFDPNNKHSASRLSYALGVPFVSIDRPCYGDSDSFLPIPEGSTFDEQTGLWLHQFILPALWSIFGVPNGCNAIVILGHSLGAMGAIITAAQHAQDKTPLYPLAGIVVSGIGTRHLTLSNDQDSADAPLSPPENLVFTPHIKNSLMFRPGTVDPSVLELTERLNQPSPSAEMQSLAPWLLTWRDRWAVHVTVPVMYSLPEFDSFFEATEDHLQECAAAFSKSTRVDTSLIKGAPHCIELSYWSQGWYARCFGFAVECAASFAAGLE
ncbi:hypothetical protein FOXG_02648 [Fusarium oxysporum f. sp. lycopersici 4287]|uniref:AB hydrolase-1 domain-containing protein n=3 Tax=Fusarium oxysporum TaxID=5507 RepID=A0A0J9UGK9_FUSO4|nr:hypothetical protein FOXG_02648 [Fusarium oxysporum f. sp. lycopersici 4287]EXK27418.1 hypothetical protein FOMG_16224 [Fusarium oxysporum f. sp. melonis 26406]KAJ9425952.1 Alpha/Beta hydrolase protein [Fusarium oxysporum]KNA98259.1 hypothetical protein FOXG_02648 [Fusarium oxysporum f. sp. lycopersici 4287]